MQRPPSGSVVHASDLRIAVLRVQWSDMKSYKIENGVKVPPPSRPKIRTTPSRAAITMQALAVGDSFLIRDELDALKAEKSMRDMNTSARDRKDGRRYVSRRLPKGLRIWRVK
jgi:hypothetical protein